MTIQSGDAISNAQTSLRNLTSKPSKSSDELGKHDFMNLFLTQMSNQSPTDPMDSGAMMSQIAQLGSMEQLENLNKEMQTLNSNQQNIARFQALQFLDRDVLMEVEDMALTKGSGKPVFYNLPKEANNLRVIIEDQDGSPVFSEQLGLSHAGRHQFNWDGKNNEGVMMGDGNYKVSFMASFMDGTSDRIQPYLSGKVKQVEYRNGQPWVSTKDHSMPLSKVMTIDNASERLFGNAAPLPFRQQLQPKPIMTKLEPSN